MPDEEMFEVCETESVVLPDEFATRPGTLIMARTTSGHRVQIKVTGRRWWVVPASWIVNRMVPFVQLPMANLVVSRGVSMEIVDIYQAVD